MHLDDYRKKIDELDLLLVDLLNQRASIVREIGRIKRSFELPICEPARENLVFKNVAQANHGPLSSPDLWRIYERIIDVMRNFQKVETPEQRDQNPGPALTPTYRE